MKIVRLSLMASIAIGISFIGAPAKADTIAAWVFELSGTQAAPYNTPAANIGTGQATQLGMSNSYTFNGSEGPGSIPFCDVLVSAGASSGSGSLGWRVRGPTNAGGGGAGQSNGWNSQAPIGTQGAEFLASTSGSGNITVSFDVNVTTQAERNLAVEYTTDGGSTWSNATITSAGNQGTLATNSSSSLTISGNYVKLSSAGTGWNNGITASVPDSNDPNFGIAIVNASSGTDCVNGAGNPLNNSSGNWRLDNVVISGASTVVPEPSTFALLAVGAIGTVVKFARRRRRHAS